MKTVDLKIAIIASKFNEGIVERLVDGAMAALVQKGIKKENIYLFDVPGAFEIPLAFKKVCKSKKYYSGVITLGCIIKGETAHFEYVSGPVCNAISNISYEYEMPLGFGVLTCYEPKQAFDRCVIPPTHENNKGFEAALVMLEMIEKIKTI